MIDDLRRLTTGKRILFICPKYFDYHIRIIQRLKYLDAGVIWIDGRPSNSVFSKTVLRYRPSLYKQKLLDYYRKSIQEEYDKVLIINPEYLTKEHIQLIKSRTKAKQIILYMWDTLANKSMHVDVAQYFDKSLTFDKTDAHNFSMEFRPLFFCQSQSYMPVRQKPIDVLFIGTGHSDRAKVVELVQTQCEAASLTYYFYLYLPNRLVYFFHKLTNINFKNLPPSFFNYRQINYDDYLDKMESSRAVLDIEHPKQTGLTMRTLEALGKERKLITTNHNITEYDFYNESNILVIDRNNPEISTEFIYGPYLPLNSELYYKYSIDGWLEDIFS